MQQNAHEGSTRPSGHLGLKVIPGTRHLQGLGAPAVLRGAPRPNLKPALLSELLRDVLRSGIPSMTQPRTVRAWKVRNLPNLYRGAWRALVAHRLGIATMVGSLRLKVLLGTGDEIDLGLVSLRVVTDTGVAAIVDGFQNTFEIETFNYHGIGTGTNAEAVGNTALQTELTTEYTGNVRATGTQSEPSANIYRTTGTNTLDSGTPAVTEHGIFTQAATGGGTLLDRSIFSAINLVGANGDGLQSQYSLTISSGG